MKYASAKFVQVGSIPSGHFDFGGGYFERFRFRRRVRARSHSPRTIVSDPKTATTRFGPCWPFMRIAKPRIASTAHMANAHFNLSISALILLFRVCTARGKDRIPAWELARHKSSTPARLADQCPVGSIGREIRATFSSENAFWS
jgi:hypothetical protein